MTTQYEKALARTREVHPDYDQRTHRGSVVEMMSNAGCAPDHIATVVTTLAGYNDESGFTSRDADLFVTDLRTREIWLAAQLQELKERATHAK